MAVKLRLQRHGRKKRPFYHIVATDSRNRRDGKFIERIGMYNPVTKPATIEIDHEKAIKWLACGAQPTDTVRSILSATGVLYKKHLYRGVAKGAFSQEEADRMFKKWLDERLKKSDARFNIGEVSALSHIKKVSATEALQQAIKETAAPVAQVVADAVETVTDAVAETAEMVAETVADTVETVEDAIVETVEDTTPTETEAPAPEEEA